MSHRTRVGIVVGFFMFAAAAVFSVVPPVPQPAAFNAFADSRAWLGIPNALDVLSNLGFLAVSLVGMLAVWRASQSRGFETEADAAPYALFFAAAGAIALGSAYYHSAPDNGRLVWDRLPMAVAFMAFLAAVVADRIDRQAAVPALIVFVLIGLASVAYWAWTESNGQGDLRFYGLVQFLPIASLPLICWLFPRPRYTKGRYLVWVFALYGIAKLLELADKGVFEATRGLVSGHTLKHLVAAAAIAVVVGMVPTGRTDTCFRGMQLFRGI